MGRRCKSSRSWRRRRRDERDEDDETLPLEDTGEFDGAGGEAKSRSESTDRATALGQLLYAGAEEYAMELLAEGRISSGKAAELLDTTVHRVHELAREHGVEIGAGPEDYRRSRQSTGGLLG